jgi:hypothetical protein
VPCYRSLLLLLVGTTAALGQQPTLADISLNDSKPAVQSKLKSRATFQREEEGQQIWELHSSAAKTLIVGFDDEGKVRYITALGTNIPCDLLGPSPQTTGKPPDLTFQRTLHPLLVIAHGSAPAHLNSCSLKNPQAKMPEEEKERH